MATFSINKPEKKETTDKSTSMTGQEWYDRFCNELLKYTNMPNYAELISRRAISPFDTSHIAARRASGIEP